MNALQLDAAFDQHEAHVTEVLENLLYDPNLEDWPSDTIVNKFLANHDGSDVFEIGMMFLRYGIAIASGKIIQKMEQLKDLKGPE